MLFSADFPSARLSFALFKTSVTHETVAINVTDIKCQFQTV